MRRLFLLLPLCLTFLVADAAYAQTTPAIVYIIRHAEKPADRSPHLTPVGAHRAELIPSLFLSSPEAPHPRFVRPDVLFATAATKHSNRPIETITPLSTSLHLRIHDDYADRETGALSKELFSGRYRGQVVLICWHHGEIPHLAEALGITNPPHWKDEVFDQVWKIEWTGGHANLTVLPQSLLPGDSR